VAHFISGYLIFVSVFLLSLFVFFNCNLVGMVLVFAIGVSKELLWDMWLGKGTPEWLDALWTIVGGFMAMLTMP
jgi:hypothetical protein